MPTAKAGARPKRGEEEGEASPRLCRGRARLARARARSGTETARRRQLEQTGEKCEREGASRGESRLKEKQLGGHRNAHAWSRGHVDSIAANQHDFSFMLFRFALAIGARG